MASFEWLNEMDRRAFLRILSLSGVAGLVYPREIIASLSNNNLSRVVIVEDNTATSGLVINKRTVQVMMDSGVKALAQQTDVGEAWKSLLPDINQNKTIAIKVNCINASMSTHPEVTYAVVEGLKKMNFSGSLFPENKIIIFDRTKGELQSAGYILNTSNSGVRCFGTNSSGVGYSSQTFNVSGSSQRLSKIITDMADYLINISLLKNHGTSGVTLCLKNHYGTCNDPGSLHDNNADPYIPALNALAPIRSKQMINICDALFGIKSGGPGGSPQFVTNKIIMSQDIVAADYWGRKLLQEKGCTTISRAYHIDTAAKNYSLGTNDPSQMEVVNISNPTTGVDLLENRSEQPEGFMLQQNYPNPFNSATQIKFYLSKPVATNLAIFDVNGQRVRRLINRTLSTGWHQISWDTVNDAGIPVASGIYIGQLRVGKFQKAIIMHLLK